MEPPGLQGGTAEGRNARIRVLIEVLRQSRNGPPDADKHVVGETCERDAGVGSQEQGRAGVHTKCPPRLLQ